VLSNQFIVFTDAKGFTRFLKSNSIEVAENFLMDCDDLINDVCDRYGGVIHQVVGDQYFVTFSDANQTLSAIETLCRNWRKIIERYKIGVAIGVHKGNLNVFRSFVHGDDINTTAHLTGLDKFCNSKRDEIFVVISGKVRNEFKRTKREGKIRKLNPERITLKNYRETAREHGAFRFIIKDDQQG
jgi:class 3 adenylate cyclase